MGDHNAPVKDLPTEIVDFYDAIVEKVAAVRLNAHETLATLKKGRNGRPLPMVPLLRPS